MKINSLILTVLPAMTYGNPGIDAVLEKLATNPQEHVILLPLFLNIQPLLQHRYTTHLLSGFLLSEICRV
ncbi:hypothetical protein ABVN80_03850 [Acinetobacter baumannii]